MTRSLAWLQGFLNLGALQAKEGLSDAAIRLQEETVLAALEILDREPGVLLADEVGMGKTYQALGLLACSFETGRAGKKQPRVLVITPNPELNHQWLRSAQNFANQGFYGGFPENAFREVRHITSLPEATGDNAVVFAPVSVFTSARGRAERGFLLELWFQQNGLPWQTNHAIRRRIEASGLHIEVGSNFLGRGVDTFRTLPQVAFRRRRGEAEGLADIYGKAGIEGFENLEKVKNALNRVRFQLIRKLLPYFDLLIVDEAHKLKNLDTVQAQAVAQVLQGGFGKAVFLTATPFQLGVFELESVFTMFGYAKEVRPDFGSDKDALFLAIKDYQRQYRSFEEAWDYVEASQATAFGLWYRAASKFPVASGPGQDLPCAELLEDRNVLSLAKSVWELRRLKTHQVEPGFRRWTIRSLKPGKLERRLDRPKTIRPGEGAAILLLLYQRLMTARSRTGTRYHIEAAETNVASSFMAALKGAMVQSTARSLETDEYQCLVSNLLTNPAIEHPKVDRVVAEAIAAAEIWEKSLIFCERAETVDNLRKTLEARWLDKLSTRWQFLYPGESKEQAFGTEGHSQLWSNRFTRSQDELYLALRESYPHTLLVGPEQSALPIELWQHSESILEDANDLLRTIRTRGISVTRVNYEIAMRCLDVAVARWFERRQPKALDAYDGLPQRLLDPAYLGFGMKLVQGPDDLEAVGPEAHAIEWKLSREVFERILHASRPSIWFPFRAKMAKWKPLERLAIVDAVRTFLRRPQVPFLVEVLEKAGGARATPTTVRDTIDQWWVQPSCRWNERLSIFLDYLPGLGEPERAEILSQALPVGVFAEQGNQSERRQKVQDAFNTPFFPMILVATETMQQGLNLQRQCRRVVHHDLPWNPADVEQRVGRVDRHGSLAERRMFETGGADGHILVDTPLLECTIDHARYRRVKEREKWFDFLLGVPPKVDCGDLDRRERLPLPTELAQDLRIHLGPTPA